MSRPRGHGYALALLAWATAVLAAVAGAPSLPPWLAAWVFALLVAAVAATAYRAASWALRDEASPAVVLAAFGLLWGAIAATIVALTGAAGCFRVPWVLAVVGLLHALAVRLLPPPKPWRDLLAGLPFGRGVNVFTAVAFVALIAAWLFVARSQLLFTTQDADSMWYHLPMAGEWGRTGSTAPIAAIPVVGIAYPGFRQAIVAFLCLPFGNEHLALLPLLELPLLALGIYTLARGWQAHRGVALAVAFYAVTTPVVVGAFGTHGNDVSLASHLLLALLFARRFVATGRTGDAVLAGTALGALAAIKFSGPGYAAIVVVAAALAQPVRAVVFTRASAMALAAAALIAAPWYVRNLVAFGNPVYPARVQVAGTVLFDGPLHQEFFARNRLGFDVGPLVEHWQHFPEAHGWLVAILGLAPVLVIAAAAARRWAWREALTVASLPIALFVLFLHHPFNAPWFDAGYTHRYLLCWFAAACAVAAAALSRLLPAWPCVLSFVAGGLLDLQRATHWVPLLAAGIVAVAGLGVLPRGRSALTRAIGAGLRVRVPVAGAAVLLAALCFGAQRVRTTLQYDDATGYRDSVSDRGWGPVMAWVHRNVRGARVGVHGTIHFFPLLGEPFSNEVVLCDDLYLARPRAPHEVAEWARKCRLDWLVCCVPRTDRTASREWVFGEAIAARLVADWPQRFAVAFESRGAAVLRVLPLPEDAK